MSSNLCILLATQRSGTNMLRSILETHPSIAALPEVFNESHHPYNHLPGFVYYEEFFLERVRTDAEWALPKNRKENVREYFKWLIRLCGAEKLTPLVDIKYNSLHHAEGTWCNHLRPPTMMQIFHNRKFPVIHLRRKSALGVVISSLRAQITNQYVASKGEEVREATITVKPDYLLQVLEMHRSIECSTTQHLQYLGIRHLELHYEDLFIKGPGSDFSRVKFNEVANFMGVDESLIELKPKTARVSSRGYRKEIANFDEIEKTLRNTVYHEDLLAGEDSRN